jgi:hypothetical protein
LSLSLLPLLAVKNKIIYCHQKQTDIKNDDDDLPDNNMDNQESDNSELEDVQQENSESELEIESDDQAQEDELQKTDIKTIKLVFRLLHYCKLVYFSTYIYPLTALRRKNNDWLARNQDNVSKWGDMFFRRLLFQ